MNRLLLEEMARPAKQAHWRIRYEAERSLGAPWPLFVMLAVTFAFLFVH